MFINKVLLYIIMILLDNISRNVDQLSITRPLFMKF